MDDFERNIRERLMAAPPNWESRAADTKERVKAMYEEKRKKAATWTWIGTAIGIALLMLGVLGLIVGVAVGNTSVTVIGAMMFLFGDGWMTGSKLLYWTWNTRFQLGRDIKEMHADVLDVLDRLERVESAVAANAAPETR
ncbi:MAG: DUF308 domain-containing protein [Candidatus Hydrogenedentales bacterium]|jgi:hypothetical protein